jgi:hypothetical protein
MRIEMKSNEFPIICLGKNATITQGETTIVTDNPYRLSIEIMWDKEWAEFLTECAHENHLRWQCHTGHRSNWIIEIFCDKSTIMWIGYWFNQWKASK